MSIGPALTSQKNQPQTSMIDTSCLGIDNFLPQEDRWEEREREREILVSDSISWNYVSADSTTL